jgi:tryptophanyl-tRNA synthetase
MTKERVLSGMRATGRMHIGHYHGALKNWVRLQDTYECYYFVADWHALTSHYDDPSVIATSTFEMVSDWLAAGLDPNRATIFMQSQLPEHAELSILLGMITPLGWLERVPTYKEQQENITDKDLATYGFLGYPVMQSADILIYKAKHVPVGEDQASHVELTREMARRFNSIYGREPHFEEHVQAALKKGGGKLGKQYEDLRRRYQEAGDAEVLPQVQALVTAAGSLSAQDRDRLLGNVTGARRVILPEPKALLTESSKLPGLDGRKMSKSYNNAIALRDTAEEVTQKIKKMPTDPQRIRRADPGDPAKCPVWNLHQVYSDAKTKEWVVAGCKSAGIGCLECKQPVIDAMNAELAPMRERAAQYDANPHRVKEVLIDGCERARKTARETMTEVRDVMGLAKLA